MAMSNMAMGASNPASALQEKIDTIKQEIPWEGLSADEKADRTRDMTKQLFTELSNRLDQFKREIRAELTQLKAHTHNDKGIAVIETRLGEAGTTAVYGLRSEMDKVASFPGMSLLEKMDTGNDYF